MSTHSRVARFATVLAGGVLATALLASCGRPAGPPPSIASADLTMLVSNSLIARVEGTTDGPGVVYVEYENDDAGRFRSLPVTVEDGRFRVYLARLRPATEYTFQVFGDNGAGDVAAGPSGLFITGELPGTLGQTSFEVRGGTPSHEVTFLEYRQEGFMGLAAFDSAGAIVWYYEGPAGEQPYVMAQRPNGNLVYVAGFEGGTTGKGLVEITPMGDEVARLVDECAPFGPIHHEVQILTDGRVLYLSRDVLRPGYGDPPVPQEGDTVGIWDPATGDNSIVWNIFDHISPADRTVPDSNRTLPGNPVWGGCDRDRTVQDWSHGNSAVMAADGTVLVSLGHLDQIVALAPDFQSVEWRLGGPGGEFTFAEPAARFYHQHTATPLPNGNILLFDNGTHRPAAEGGHYSRALELELDFDTMSARRVWQFPDGPDIYAECCSSATRLANGNTVVMFGTGVGRGCCGPFVIVEVDAEGVVQWEVLHHAPTKRNQYRVYPADSIIGEVRVAATGSTRRP